MIYHKIIYIVNVENVIFILVSQQPPCFACCSIDDKLYEPDGDVVHFLNKFILIFLLLTNSGIGQTRIFLLSIDVTIGIFCTFSRREPARYLKIKITSLFIEN